MTLIFNPRWSRYIEKKKGETPPIQFNKKIEKFSCSFFRFSLSLYLCLSNIGRVLLDCNFPSMVVSIPLIPYPLISQVLHTPFPNFPSSSSLSSPKPPQILLQTPTAGRSLFSTRPLEPSTNLMTENLPIARCLLKEYIKEVCWECWLERGQERKWSIRESNDYDVTGGDSGVSGGKGNVKGKGGGKGKGKDIGGIRWFCSSECRTVWRERVGKIGREASRLGEIMIKEGKERKIPSSVEEEDLIEPERSITLEELEESWQLALIAGEEIIRLRTDVLVGGGKLKNNVKLARKLVEGLNQFDDEDMVRFLIEGFISRYLELHPSPTSPSTTSSVLISPLPTPRWNSLCSLVPSLAMYLSISTGNLSLLSNIRMYHSFLLHLPLELLEVITSYTISIILSRDLGNSFGTSEEFEGGAPPSLSSSSLLSSPSLDSTIVGRGQQVGFALYPILSFYNHSCSPNIIKKRTGTTYFFSTIPTRIVEEGEELCISYLGGEERSLSRVERRDKLREGWGFDCCCIRCENEM